MSKSVLDAAAVSHTETMIRRYLEEVKDLYSAEHPPLDVADTRAAEPHRTQNENILVFAAGLDKMQ